MSVLQSLPSMSEAPGLLYPVCGTPKRLPRNRLTNANAQGLLLSYKLSQGPCPANWSNSYRKRAPGLNYNGFIKKKTTSEVLRASAVQDWVRVGDPWIH